MLNNIQERVERSMFEAIRKVAILEGYTPDVTLRDYTQKEWQQALSAIASVKGFAIDVFGHSTGQDKGVKQVPRIAVIPRRILPGDIGSEGNMGFELTPNNLEYRKRLVDLNSVNLHIEINLVSASAQQERTLNALLAKALGQRRYIPFYDNPEELFLAQQFSFYDLPDVMEGIEEKVYSYEIKDIWLYDELSDTPTSKIKEIDVEDNNDETITIGGL